MSAGSGYRRGHDRDLDRLQTPPLPGCADRLAVWLYFRFPASLRLVEELLLERGIIVSYETIRRWAAKRELAPGIEHRSHKGLNNRAENSHPPLRRRECQMQGFRSAGGLQRFTSVFSAVRNLFVPPAGTRPALSAYLHRLAAFARWRSVAGLGVPA